MDIFFRNENIEVFKKWIYFQVENDPRLTLEECDSQKFYIHYHNRTAQIVMWPKGMGIIEESIMEDDQIIFYLHYEFKNYQFAKNLFDKMIDKLVEEKHKEIKKILLCCTGGMTTGFFAEKLNKYSELCNFYYHFDATALYKLNNFSHLDYDMILLAPQLRYKALELSLEYKDITVKCIDPDIFATYDCEKLIQEIEKSYNE